MNARTLIRHTLRLALATLPLTLTSCAGGQVLLMPTGIAVRGAASVAAFAAAAVWLVLLVRVLEPERPRTDDVRRRRRVRRAACAPPRTLSTAA